MTMGSQRMRSDPNGGEPAKVLAWIERICHAGHVPASALHLACTIGQELVSADRWSVLSIPPPSDPTVHQPSHVEASVAACPTQPDSVGRSVDVEQYPEVAAAVATQQMVLIDDVHDDARFAPLELPDELRSVAAIPLFGLGRLVGVLHVRSSSRVLMTEVARSALAQIASVAGMALGAEQALAREQLAIASAQEQAARGLRASNRRLRRLNKIKDELVAVCAHDLRAPITVISGHVDVLLGERIGPLLPRQRQSVERIQKQSERMLGLLEELLGARALGVDSLEVTPRTGDLAALVRECIDELAVSFQDRHLACTLDVKPAPALGTVLFDAAQLRKVVVNLLTNALKYTPPGGAITVALAQQDHSAHLRITDTGPGIAAPLVERIFEPYRRGDHAHGTPGVGLGLAICREIVERHGGEIWVESEVARGSTFHVAMPIEGDALEPASAPAAQRKHIVLIDDDPVDLETTAGLLENAGYHVTTLSDGGVGIPEVRGNPPDLILLDIKMPGVSGFEVAQRLKLDARTADVPILFLSGSSHVEDRVRGLELGADAVLLKPFHARELIANIERSLHSAAERALIVAQAMRDELTGVGNYRYFVEHRGAELERARRYGYPLALVVMDLDHLKSINERLGHSAGSHALARLGHILRAEARRSDIVARYGGDEFVALLPHASLAEAYRFAERIRSHLTEVVLAEVPEPVRPTVSVGVTALLDTDHGPALEEAFARADAAVFAAKREGGDRVVASAGEFPS